MDTRQWAELSAVNGVVAKYEDTFLDGKETQSFGAYAPEGKGDYFHPYSKEEDNMVQQAMKVVPTDHHHEVKDHRSIEPDDTHKVSPVTGFKGWGNKK